MEECLILWREMFVVSYCKNATLKIGDNSGISSGCLWVSQSVTIGDNVKIGALTIVTDTDSHS